MDNVPDEEMQRLYSAFMSAIDNGDDLSTFSKDDLIDIYDFSRGIPNDYYAYEAIAEGLRRYPKSRDLIKRKAFYFHDLGHDDLCDTYLLSLPERSFARSMAYVKNEHKLFGSKLDFGQYLSDYAAGSIEDGDIIFMVDIFLGINEIDAVARYADEIASISQYPSTIFSELYNAYYDKEDYVRALNFGKKLTDVEPFNASSWIELANLYLMKIGDRRAAIECAEYASAIDPDNISPKMIIALASYDDDPIAARKMVDDVLKDDGDNEKALYVGARMDYYENRYNAGTEKILRSIDRFSLSARREPFDLLLRNLQCPLGKEAKEKLSMYIRTDDSVSVEQWVENLAVDRCYIGAIELFRVACEANRYDLERPQTVYVVSEILYRIGDYRGLIKYLSGVTEAESLTGYPVSMVYLVILSLYRLGETEAARDILIKALNHIVSSGQADVMAEGMIRRLMLPSMKALLRKIDGDLAVRDRDFDPYC